MSAAGQLVDVVEIHQHALGDVHVTQHHGDAQDVFHAAPGDRHLAPVLDRNVDDLLQAVHVGGEGRDDDALVTAEEELVKAHADAAFRLGVAGTLHIGGIAQQREHALVTELAKAHKVDHAAGDRRHVDSGASWHAGHP